MVDSTTTFLLDLGILAGFALVFSLLFALLKLSVVPAQIVAGMVAGPYVLNWVNNPLTINDLSAIGIVLLLFIIGLELDPVELRRMAGKVGVVAMLEVGIAFVLGFGSAYYLLGADPLQSTVFAMVTSITSTAIVGKIFLERKANSPESRALIGLMILEDMFAVIFLIVLSSLASDETLLSAGSLERIAMTAAGGAALVIVGYLVATFVAPRIIDYLGAFEEEYEEIPFLFALGLGFFFAILAAQLGYSPGTGAFIIGLSIRGKRSKFLETRLRPLKDLFIVLFFISMGTLIDPTTGLAAGLPLVGVMALVIAGKFLGGIISSKTLLQATTNKSAYLFGSWLVPRGEFSFVIGQLALTLGIIDANFFSVIGLVVLTTALVGPVMQKFGEKKSAPSIFPSRPMADP